MKAAIDMLYECNSLRTTDNNFSAGSLKVNDVLMAAAQMNANWAVLKSGFNYNSHARVFNVAENLAWYPNSWSPFDGWYTEEKALYDSGNNTYSEVGHYINMTNPSYSITGYGIRNSAEMTRYSSHAQDFDGSSGSYGESYTVDEYKARFMEYYNSLYNAEQTYNAAVANRDALQAYYDKLLELNGITDSSVLTTTTAAIATTTTQGTSAEAPSVVNFNLYGKDTIPAATMTAIAGKNVTLSVAVDANTLVTIDGNQLALSDASAVKLISGSAADGKASLSVRSNNLDTQKTVTIYYYFGADKAGSQAALYFVNGDNSLLEFRTSAVYENGYAAFTAPLVNANYEISLK
jgi:hypothetical protein